MLAQCPNIRYIGELATGFDNLDLEAIREQGIAVANVPDYGGIAVASTYHGIVIGAYRIVRCGTISMW